MLSSAHNPLSDETTRSRRSDERAGARVESAAGALAGEAKQFNSSKLQKILSDVLPPNHQIEESSGCFHSFIGQATAGDRETFDLDTLSEEQPPVSNTGAEITTAPKRNQILIDFLSFTFPREKDPEKVCNWIGIDFEEFGKCSCGSMGYKSAVRLGNISVLYDGSEGMGVHVSMTGQGCRQYEALLTGAFPSLFENVIIREGKFTRLDIAIDNIDGKLNLDKLQGEINEKNIRSRFKSGRTIKQFSLSRNSEDQRGCTVYIGSAQSRIQIRYYDKAAQLGLVDQYWTRAELQLREERAQKAVEMYLEGTEIGEIASGTINNYFTVINHDDSNISRCSTKKWWAEWINSAKKLHLTVEKAIKTIYQVTDWMEKQYAPTIAMLKEHYKHDFIDLINSFVRTGRERMTMKHEQILYASQ